MEGVTAFAHLTIEDKPDDRLYTRSRQGRDRPNLEKVYTYFPRLKTAAPRRPPTPRAASSRCAIGRA